MATAQESEHSGGTTKSLPKELAVDLGGGVKMDFVLIPAGSFMMGSPVAGHDVFSDERPPHRVRITRPFYLGKYLVTQQQWQAVMGTNPSHFKGANNPIENVPWADCQTFLEKLNAKRPPARENSNCPPRPSGNMPAGPGARRAMASAMTGRNWANMPGIARTPAATTHPVGREEAQCLGALRHARQPLGVVLGLV